jgi:MFS family permease
MGREGVEVRSIAVAERAAKSDVRAKPTMQQLGDFRCARTIPLQALITVVSPLAGMLCRRFGRRLPLFAGGTVVALGCTMALRVGPNATYWADIFPSILLLALGMSLAIAPLTTLVLTSVESDRAETASGVNSAVSRAGSLFAIALLGGVLQQGGPQLFAGFHWRWLSPRSRAFSARSRCSLSSRGPTSTSSRETDRSVSVIRRPATRKQ